MDRVLIGTSDLKIENPDEARCTEEEVDYFFDLVKRVFPNIAVGREHIVFRFSGVRPLPASDANTTGQISRDHINRIQDPDETLGVPVYNLIGGKWTTHRAFAEQVTDSSLQYLGKSRVATTSEMPFGGGRDYPKGEVAKAKWLQEQQQHAELSLEVMRRLFERYGTRASDIARFMAADNDAPLEHQPEYSRREIVYLAQNEGVERLDDILLRRTLLAMLGQVTKPLLAEINSILATALNWDESRQAFELDRAIGILADEHSLNL